jgi:hypothetical protein
MADVYEYIQMNNNNLLYNGDFVDRSDDLITDDLILIWWDERGGHNG